MASADEHQASHHHLDPREEGNGRHDTIGHDKDMAMGDEKEVAVGQAVREETMMMPATGFGLF